MVNLIIKAFKRYAWFKRINAKITYEILAKYIPAEEWRFMNYGYVPTEAEPPLALPDDPTLQKYPLQMYHYLATQVDLRGKTVLEVGSGRGGGAHYIATHLQPASYTGLDLAQRAVDLANRLYQSANLRFIQGSAEKIPLPDNSIDVVINVESCHAYGSVPAFLGEVTRVLKPGGYFLMVDFRNEVKNMDVLHAELRATELTWLKHENISERVIMAIEAENDSKVARIEKLVPPRWHTLFGDFAGVVGSRFYNTLKDGTRVYHRFVLRKG
ncbi:MAG: class I SAM-dependent methyltransferase [Cyclobacteriaceae bacterium]|jgi:SAM-dependent methyltransferase|nr:class I SAM-dependent methyltransferase [Cyclobacteriaceae bacterium]